MKTADFRRMLEVMANAWSQSDYRKVVAFFSDDLFYSDGLNYSFQSKNEMLEFFEKDDGREQICVFHNLLFDDRNQI